MKFNKPYRCIIYEEGDVVFPKYPSFDSVPRKVIDSRLDILGKNTVTQLLKLEGLNDDLNVSNFFVPYGEETRAKYADGLKYYTGVDKQGNIIKNNDTVLVVSTTTKERKKVEKPSPPILAFKLNPIKKE